jgi:dCMP deaminase
MRPTWDEYFLSIAQAVAARSTCDRLHVGAVVVKDNRIIGTGYNGAPPGEPHCDDDGHLMVDNHCKRTIHAEVNAINHARQAHSLYGATIYVTHRPCILCQMEIGFSGIGRIVYMEEYGSTSLLNDDLDDEELDEYYEEELEEYCDELC